MIHRIEHPVVRIAPRDRDEHDIARDHIVHVDAAAGRRPEVHEPRPRTDWRDPFSGRAMTWGEWGCAMSHIKAWRFAAKAGRTTLILEDDARLRVGVDALADALDSVDDADAVVANLCPHTIPEPGPQHGRLLFGTDAHMWWTCAIAVTPLAARFLLDEAHGRRFPVTTPDEYLPALIGRNSNETENRLYDPLGARRMTTTQLAAMQRMFEPADHESATERGPYVPARPGAPVTVVSWATDAAHPGWRRLRASAARHGFPPPLNLLAGAEWDGGDMSRPGGMRKFIALAEWLEGRDMDEAVLAVDGYDVVLQAHARDVADVCPETRVLVGGEATPWPDPEWAARAARAAGAAGDTPHPCSGVLLGRAGTMRGALGDVSLSPPDDDDQHHLHRMIAARPGLWRVDAESRWIVTLNAHPGPLLADRRRRQLVVGGDRWPYVAHGNNGFDLDGLGVWETETWDE